MDKRINQIIEDIRPSLQNDGGDIEFVEYKNNIVYVKITGMCMHCHMLQVTLAGIENIIKDQISEVKSVELV